MTHRGDPAGSCPTPSAAAPAADAAPWLEASFEPLLVLDARGQVLAANRAARSYATVGGDDTAPVPSLSALLDPEPAARLLAATSAGVSVSDTAADARGLPLELRLRPLSAAADGSPRAVLGFRPSCRPAAPPCTPVRLPGTVRGCAHVLAALPMPWAVKDRGLRIVDCNPAFEALTGRPRAELIGRRVDEIAPAEHARDLLAQDERALASTTPTTMVHVLEGTEGQKRIVRLTRAAFRDGGGEVAGLLVLAQDVTRELDSPNALAVNGALVQTILDYMPGFISLKDATSRRFLFATGTDQVLDGKPNGYLIGRNAAEIYEPELARAIDAQESRLLEQPDQVIDRRFQHVVGGRPRWFYSRKLVVPGQDGAPRYLLTFNLDVTRQVEAEQALDRANRFLDTLFDTIPALLSVREIDSRRYVRVNPTFARFVGQPVEAILSDASAAVVLGDPHEEEATDRLLLAGRPLVQRTFEADTAYGRRWLAGLEVLVRDETGTPSHILTLAEDVTERVRAERELAESRTFLRTILEHLPWPLWVQEAATGRVLLANFASWSPPSSTGTALPRTGPEDVFGEAFARALAGLDARLRARPADPIDEEIEEASPDGSRWHHVRKVAVADGEGGCRYILTIDEDVTERRRMLEDLRQSEASLRRSQAIARIGSWRRPFDDDRLDWSVEMYRLWDEDPRSFTPILDTIAAKLTPEDRSKLDRVMAAAPAEAATRQSVVVRVRLGDGRLRHLSLHAEIEHDATGLPTALIGTCQDVTERIETERHVRHLAQHDPLTGLPNRLLFDERLVRAVNAAGTGGGVALHCLDLNDFKGINDTLGHAAGDELLRQVARRLSETLRERDVVARLGGDEFAILQSGVEGPEAAARLAERLIDATTRPFLLDGQEVFSSISIGVALPAPGVSPAELLRQADLALYAAKASGRGSYRFFSPEMQAKLQERKRIEARLRVALAQNGLHLAYQPQYSLKTGALVGVEALVRWHDAELGLVTPDRFVPIAEETAQILQLGEFVLREACAQARRWQDAGLPIRRVAVNLSPAQFAYQDLVVMVASVLRETGIPPEALELEITESTLMRDRHGAVATLRALHELGVGLALDDFGTGYSSLSYLKRFPLDKIKIDRSFVTDLPYDPDDVAIARTILSLGKTLGLKVLAEGVETAAQRDFLNAEGCDEAQGYLFARPMSAAQIDALFPPPRPVETDAARSPARVRAHA